MSYDGVLKPSELGAVVSHINTRLNPALDRGCHVSWADALIEAFAAVGRGFVFLDAGPLSNFYVYGGQGAFLILRELEIESLLYACGDRCRLRQGTVRSIVRALKAQAGVSEEYFAPGARCVVCPDVTLVFDWSDPDIIRCEDHSAAHRARSRIPVPFLPNSGSDRLGSFLDGAFGDAIAIERLTELVGLALFGEGCLYQKVFLLHGEGLNGKGVVGKLIKQLFPYGQVTAVPPKDIPPEWGRAQLQGSRLNFVGELDRLGEEDITALKSLVTGEPMSARNSRERGFTLAPEALHIVATNRLPKLGEAFRALARRFVVIPMPNAVELDKQDPLFERRLLAESLSALLNLCIENAAKAAQRLRSGTVHFEMSPAMQAATAGLFGADPVAEFVSRNFVLTNDLVSDRIPTEHVRAAYERYCGETRQVPMGQPKFVARLADFGVPSAKYDTMHLVGLRWRPAPFDREPGEAAPIRERSAKIA